MHYIKLIFASLKTEFLIRNYVIGIMVSAVFLLLIFNERQLTIAKHVACVVHILISFILFPFSVYVYEKCKSIMMGDNTITTSYNSFGDMLFKIFLLKAVLFYLAVIIAPLGIIYLLYKIKKEERQANIEADNQAQNEEQTAVKTPAQALANSDAKASAQAPAKNDDQDPSLYPTKNDTNAPEEDDEEDLDEDDKGEEHNQGQK